MSSPRYPLYLALLPVEMSRSIGKPTRESRRWRLATVAWMAGILIVSLLPGTAATPGGWLWHLLGYGILGILWGHWQRAWSVWALGTGYGALVESLQWLVPYRRAEVEDLAVNAFGMLLGVLLVRTVRGQQRTR